jgi:pimeloyl-ACP methyl ester carboxylesterase
MPIVKPRMMLERIERGARDGEPVLLLHDAEGHPDQLSSLADRLEARRLIIPRAPRWASMRGPGLFSWFTAAGPGRFDPVTFGDSLSQLELLLLSLGDHRIGAVGVGQGATILSALCALWPERFDWVALVGGFWPALARDLLPSRSMVGLSVLIERDAVGGRVDHTQFVRCGARVAEHDVAQGDTHEVLVAWVDRVGEQIRVRA